MALAVVIVAAASRTAIGGPAGEGALLARLQVSADQAPRLDSSTSAQPIAATLLGRMHDIAVRWDAVWGGKRRVVPDRLPDGVPMWSPPPEMGYMPSHADRRLKSLDEAGVLQTNGTHGAYTSLIRGESDLVLVARTPSDDERAEAQRAGVELDVQPIARDAFVFVVHGSNPVPSLTLEQIRSIYTGQITNWVQVGGEDRVIRPYQRNRNSGSQELMDRLVLQGATMVEAPTMTHGTMGGPVNAAAADPSALGYTVYFYERNMSPTGSANPRLLSHMLRLPEDELAESRERRLVPIDEVTPDEQTIASGAYPLVTHVYAVIRADAPADSPARRLRNWLQTPEGQHLVAETGYVPLTEEGSR